MGKFESIAFNKNQDLLELILLWKRHIDDVFSLFKGSEEQCGELAAWLNSILPEVVKFKLNFSTEKIEILDLEISIIDGKLETNLYIKPNNLQLYLDYSSNHPQHCKIGIIYSQALRIIERCSRPENVYLYLENLKDKLKARNYPEERIEQHFEKAKKKSRQELINQNRKNKKKNDGKTD